ncbi:efflux RND transporter periplasmic adaptor subunit [Jiella sonneratiae]|uniref:Efflux RND transporter periplasmic adaptor subunit n=1 Tax=Jiella sonneratiae TaxID=2816856 RepID=A0ABS3J0B9_9HYPH|nr:efflux RND transporter periplasmic adaptor subunit [Jiella sonneratiae]MBO0903108.1 efflux RND transporter periplasmic adaptor subunit [Jiella sonneratiae]
MSGENRPSRASRLATASALPLCLILASCSDEAAPAAPPQIVAFVTAEPKVVNQMVSLTGTIVARNTATYAFETGGRVTDVFVDVGDRVSAGEVLAKLDPTQQQASVAAAKAAVASAEASLTEATSAFDRQSKLLAQGFTTRSDYDSAEQTLASARSKRDAAKSDLVTANNDLDDTVLKADANGVITSRSVDPGQVVSAASAAFGFARAGALDAEFRIQEQLLISGKRPGQIRVALVEDPSVVAIGHIREISPLIDSSTGTVLVKVGLDDPPEAMNLGAAVVGYNDNESVEKAIGLPWTSLVVSGGKPAVWVVAEDGTARLTEIAIAAYRTDDILVAKGVEAGQRVVSAGAQLVLPNQKLEIVAAGAKDAAAGATGAGDEAPAAGASEGAPAKDTAR